MNKVNKESNKIDVTSLQPSSSSLSRIKSNVNYYIVFIFSFIYLNTYLAY
jgi:hypothetical protein